MLPNGSLRRAPSGFGEASLDGGELAPRARHLRHVLSPQRRHFSRKPFTEGRERARFEEPLPHSV